VRGKGNKEKEEEGKTRKANYKEQYFHRADESKL
jgi:hypothetical protein